MDPGLFEQTVLPHLNAAYNLGRWMTRNGDDAEDVVQEAYLKAFRSFQTCQATTAEETRAWLLAIVRNTCLTWLRKKGATSMTEFNEETHTGRELTPDGESVLLSQAALGHLNGCVEALPPEFREVIVLREIEELPYKEVAGIAGVPIGTIMSRLARARRRLQDCMTAGRQKA